MKLIAAIKLIIILLKMFDLMLSASVETVHAPSVQIFACAMVHIAVETRLATPVKNENMWFV